MSCIEFRMCHQFSVVVLLCASLCCPSRRPRISKQPRESSREPSNAGGTVAVKVASTGDTVQNGTDAY